MQKNILLVEDNEEFASYFLTKFFDLGNLEHARSLDEGLKMMSKKKWDLFFLDLYLNGDKTCFDLIPTMRASFPRAQVMIVTGNADKATAIRAANAGVDGFLEKPIAEEELRRRLEEIGWFDTHFALDGKSRELFVGPKSYSLTQVEFTLLSKLMDGKNQLVTRVDLERGIWNGRHMAKNALDTHLYNLKRKVPELKSALSSVHGTGYLLKVT